MTQPPRSDSGPLSIRTTDFSTAIYATTAAADLELSIDPLGTGFLLG